MQIRFGTWMVAAALVATVVSMAAAPAVHADPDPDSAVVYLEIVGGSAREFGAGAEVAGAYDLIEGEVERIGRPVHLSLEQPNGSVTPLSDAIVDAEGAWAASLPLGTFHTAGVWVLRAETDAFATWPAASANLVVPVLDAPGSNDPPPPPPAPPAGDGGGTTTGDGDGERDPLELDPVAVRITSAAPKVVKFHPKCATKRIGCPVFIARIAPAEAGLQVRFVVEKLVKGKWKAAGGAMATTKAGGVAKVLWKPGPRPAAATTKLRVRWIYAGDDAHLDARSAWMAVTLRR